MKQMKNLLIDKRKLERECLLPPAFFMKQMKNLLIDKRKLERCHGNASNCLINCLLDRHTAGYIVFTKPTLMEI